MSAPIPHAVLQQHVAILGKTGSGKTSTGKLLVEQVVDAADGSRVCVLDTIKSDWWGLTSSAHGTHPGLPFHILGGPRGHVPLHDRAGAAIAELVATGALPLSIIDMKRFGPGGQQRFFVDFAPVLLERMQGVLYLVIEEAHILAPKERAGFEKENLSVHWAKMLATAGRSTGIRLVVLTQRTQALHNALLGSCDTLIAHRMTAPADQTPVVGWLKANIKDKAVAATVADDMSGLPTGTGWLVSGEARLFQRVQFARIKTFDNSATPTAAAAELHVATAPVDLEKLRAIVGEAVKEAEANNPEALRAEIARLKRALERRAPAQEEGGFSAELEAARAHDVATAYERGRSEALSQATAALGRIAREVEASAQVLRQGTPVTAPVPTRMASGETASKAAASPQIATAHHDQGRREGKILNALAELEQLGVSQPERVQVAFLAGYTHTSSKGFANALGAARSGGLIDYPAAGRISLTAEGRRLAKAPAKPRTTGQLQERLLQLLGGAHARVLEPLIKAYPRPVQRDELAQMAGYTHTSSKGFANAMGRLRSLGFIDYPGPGRVAAQPVLFLER